MSTTQNLLKFIHLASTAAASEGSYDKGAIIFEPKSGRIAVKGNSGLEYYGGGRIADATFNKDTKILTISFNDGITPAITLDFSDTASAGGVNKILGQLRTDVNALADKVGDDSKGLVKKINDNTSNISANKGEIDANKAAIAAINHETTGILAQAKTYTNTKISDLKGVGADDDETLKKLRDSITTLEGKHADGKTVAQEIIDKVGTGITGTVKDYVEGKVSTINETTAGLRTDVDGLKGRADTLEGRATALEGRATALEGRADALEADVEANTEAIAAINHETTGILAQAKSYTNDAKKAANDYTDGEVVKINTAADVLKGRVTTLEGTVGKKAEGDSPATGLHKDIADLQALHANKTNGTGKMTVADEAKAAAVAEVAKVVASAPEDFNTLKEIADWIANDKDGAAAMQSAIGTLKTTVGDKDSGLVKKVNDNATAIDALEALHVSGKTVAQEVTNGINKITEASASAGTDVVVTVKTKSGSVSAVTVDASGIRNDLGQKTAAASADTAFGRIKALETTVGDKDSGLVKDVATNTTNISNNTASIKALQDAQASGSLMWSVWQD